MRRKAVIDRLYLFFWFFPIVLLPFTWVNAVVQGAEILGLIQGSGFVVSRNFPALTVFYLVISVGLLLPKSLINHYNWQLLYFSCLLIFTSMFSLLPRTSIWMARQPTVTTASHPLPKWDQTMVCLCRTRG